MSHFNNTAAALPVAKAQEAVLARIGHHGFKIMKGLTDGGLIPGAGCALHHTDDIQGILNACNLRQVVFYGIAYLTGFQVHNFYMLAKPGCKSDPTPTDDKIILGLPAAENMGIGSPANDLLHQIPRQFDKPVTVATLDLRTGIFENLQSFFRFNLDSGALQNLQSRQMNGLKFILNKGLDPNS